MSETTAVQAAGTTDNVQKKAADKEWFNETKKKFLDLSTSNSSILQTIEKAAGNENFSEEKMLYLNTLINMRAQAASMISNTLRVMFDTIAGIIRNING